MTATSLNTQIHKLQVIQNKALRFIYNIKYDEYITNETLHNRAKLATVKDRLNYLRNKQMDKLNLLINDDDGGNISYKLSDYIIEDDPLQEKTNKLKDLYMRFGLLNDNNELT